VGECILESRLNEQSLGGFDFPKDFVPVLDRSFHEQSSTQGKGSSFGGLEGTGWFTLTANLSLEDADLL
jgi:hypothetical protein